MSGSLKLPVTEEAFTEHLLFWYDRNRRELPWRDNPAPYRVWISEIMLQQTRVKAVLPYFERFLESFPTILELAEASEEQVLTAWSGLGYYSRARNLLKSARIVRDRFGGVFPQELQKLLELPGIGRYTAGAILSIAFNQAQPVLDGNVRRVFSRFLQIETELKSSQLSQIWRLLDELVRCPTAQARPSDFNQALMELGAIVCTPRNPDCSSCPVSEGCRARQAGVQDQLPIRARKKPTENRHYLVAIVRRRDEYLLKQNEEEPFLNQFWEFPRVAGGPDPDSRQRLEECLGTRLVLIHFHEPVRHQITFRKLQFHPVEARILGAPPSGKRWAWSSLSDPELPVPAYVQKIRKKLRPTSDS